MRLFARLFRLIRGAEVDAPLRPPPAVSLAVRGASRRWVAPVAAGH